jgi:hypothetical protein
MWEHIEVVGEFDTVIQAVKEEEGRAIWCTDGSFDRLQMPEVSSTGWVIFDPISKYHIKGSFFEISKDASAYRGKLLGLTALHLVAAAISELFGPIENSIMSYFVIMNEPLAKQNSIAVGFHWRANMATSCDFYEIFDHSL